MERLFLHPKVSRMIYSAHLKRLDQFLVENKYLWQPQPFKTERPQWCETHPELTDALLGLDETELAFYAADNEALISLLSGFIPELAAIHSLIELPTAEAKQQSEIEPRLHAGIPGRKWLQINALYQGMDNPGRAITEWCGGKGYLGRLLSKQSQQLVTTLEYNQDLVEAGIKLADKHNADQQFKTVDVLNDPVSEYLSNHHPIALHACGDLHRELVNHIISSNTPSFTIVPCCYHLGRHDNYSPFNQNLKLQLSREELRLAVNETVTAHHGEIQKRNQDMAWKLGFQQLRAELTGISDYYPFNPVPKAWLKEGFKSYCQKLCQREQLTLPAEPDWESWEAKGYARQHDVLRLQLLRQCFKRAVELWLIMDMAACLEKHAYSVNISVFCDRALTPRNIMIEGER